MPALQIQAVIHRNFLETKIFAVQRALPYRVHIWEDQAESSNFLAAQLSRRKRTLHHQFIHNANRRPGSLDLIRAIHTKTESPPFESQKADQNQDTTEPECESMHSLELSVTTFNVLAPIYKRLGPDCSDGSRESEFEDKWSRRHQDIIKSLLSLDSTIICLQEFWIENPEFVAMYEEALEGAGYSTFMLSRTNERGDGLLTAVKHESVRVVHYHELQFNDVGDRVAQIAWLRFVGRELQLPQQDLILVNTHLLFPHDATSSLVRVREVHKLLEHLEVYQSWHCHKPTPVLLCGDLNGSKEGTVFKFLRSQGFRSSYDVSHDIPDTRQGWVSHKNHRGQLVGVDYIWFLNPMEQCHLASNWKIAAFQYLTAKLERAGFKREEEVFEYLCRGGEINGEREGQGDEGGDSDNFFDRKDVQKPEVSSEDMTMSKEAFVSAVSEMGFELALSESEVQQLMDFADTDGNGVIDFQEFQAVVDRVVCMEAEGQRSSLHHRHAAPLQNTRMEQVGAPLRRPPKVVVKSARFIPESTESGLWPADYEMSDHALLHANLYLIEG